MSDSNRHSAPYAETAGDRARCALVLDLGPLPVLDSVCAWSSRRDRIFCIRVYNRLAQLNAEICMHAKPRGKTRAV